MIQQEVEMPMASCHARSATTHPKDMLLPSETERSWTKLANGHADTKHALNAQSNSRTGRLFAITCMYFCDLVCRERLAGWLSGIVGFYVCIKDLSLAWLACGMP